jgi:8-oxo-dGDP phosphatase
MTAGFVRRSERSLHRWHVWDLVEGAYASPTGEHFERTFVRSPGAVSIIAVDETAQPPTVVLIKQWRAAMEAEMWEVPAGMRDIDGEDPVATARRELIEEVGIDAADWELLTVFLPSVGITDGSHHVYLARGLTDVGATAHGPEEEHIVMVRPSLSEALAMVWDGTIKASSAVIGLLMAGQRLGIGAPVASAVSVQSA